MACKNITISLDSAGLASIFPIDIDDGSFDNCAIEHMLLSRTTFDCSALGENQVTLTAIDKEGNVDSCFSIVTVQDVLIQTDSCLNINLYLDSIGSAGITAEQVYLDNTYDCDAMNNSTLPSNITLSLSDSLFDCENIFDQEALLHWTNVGSPSFSAGSTNYQSLVVYNGEPFVAYRDGAYGNRATVMKYNGDSWVYIGSPGFSAGQAEYLSLAFYGGEPYLAYNDGGYGYRVTAMKYNGTNWVNVGNPGFSSDWALDISLAFNNSEPYVAFQDGTSKTSVMRYNGISWIKRWKLDPFSDF